LIRPGLAGAARARYLAGMTRPLTPRAATLAALAAGAALLAGCAPEGVKAPTEPGACWHLVTLDDGTTKFNRVGGGQPDLEHCAPGWSGCGVRS
jgi:hypothetical protein